MYIILVNQQKKNTALVLFTRTFQEERLVKDVFAFHKRSERFYNLLIERVRSQASYANTDFFVLKSTDQIGNSFSARLKHAFELFFQQGYHNVILVGNDSPSLSSGDLRKAEKALKSNNLVVGPTRKGGVYLIGMQREYFYTSDIFSHISWQTNTVYKDFLKFFGQSIVSLRVQRDLNSLEDFRSFIGLFSTYTFLKNIWAVFDHTVLVIRDVIKTGDSGRNSFHGLRAPPTIFLLQ